MGFLVSITFKSASKIIAVPFPQKLLASNISFAKKVLYLYQKLNKLHLIN